LLNDLLAAKNIQQAVSEHLDEINDTFIQVLNRALQDANKKNDAVLMPKLQQIVDVLQKASAPPPELALLEEMLAAPDETALNKMIEQHAAEITPEFSSIVASVISRSEEQASGKTTGEEAQMLEKLQTIYRAILKSTMRKNLS
jgi:PleD family two-component response regulator